GAGNVANLLAMLSDRVRSMHVPLGMMNELRRRYLPALARDEALPEEQARRALQRALYGNHPYGRVITAKQLGEIDEGAVVTWLKRLYQPQNATVKVIGDVNENEVEALAREWLGEWEADPDGRQLPPPPPSKPTAQEVIRTARPGAGQGELELTCLLPTTDEQHWPLYDLMASLAARRLFHDVRDRLGASYGISGRALLLRGGTTQIVLAGNVASGQLEPALAAIKKSWEGLARGEVGDSEMKRIQWDIARSFSLHLMTSAELAHAVSDMRRLGWPVAAIDRYPQHLAAATKADLVSAFKACASTQVLSIVGDEPTVRTAMAASW